MTNIRIISDVHLEFFKPEHVTQLLDDILPPKETDDILIIAGDFCCASKEHIMRTALLYLKQRFNQVIYALGNHEYYDSTIVETEAKISAWGYLFNLATGQKEVIDLSGRRFLVCTLWTDLDKENPRAIMDARHGMNDYFYIYDDTRRLTPTRILEIHKDHRQWLENEIKEGDVVITHHLPSYRSCDPKFAGDSLNPAFASELHEMILDKKPAYWIHGHTHAACDYMIGDTRVICNPVGYGGQHLRNGYNNNLMIEV